MSGDQPALSLRNPSVQHLRRLLGRRRARVEAGQFAFEGPTLVREALRSHVALEAVYIDADAASNLAPLRAELPPPVAVHLLQPGVLDKIADTISPQGVVAVARRPHSTLDDVLPLDRGGLVFVLDAVSDPGNAGAIVRIAEAVGAAAVVFTAGSTDPFGPKTIRASAGSAFRVPMVADDAVPAVVTRVRRAGLQVVGTVAMGGADYRRCDLSGPLALVLGNEAHGLTDEVESLLDLRVSIPMQGQVESLNVAATAAVLGFEHRRQTDASDGDT
jgi:TrmH family RNA methyltransferase